jgi:integrase/recombinase XerD
MPRKTRETRRQWRVAGVVVGFVRDGVHYIDRTLPGFPRVKRSTGCIDPKAAEGEYRRFERDPARYVPGRAGPPLWDTAVKGYLRYSALTRQNTERHVRKQGAYFENLAASGLFPNLETFSSSDVRTYMAWRANGGAGRKVGRPAVNRDLAALKALMSWARSEKLTTNDADREVPLLKEDQGANAPREIPEKTWREVNRRLLERWCLASEVILGVGLRYGELARMKPEDLEPGATAVPRSKRRQARTIPASMRTIASAKRLLDLGGVPDDEAGQFDHRLRVACAAAGVTLYSAHELRHTYATVCLRNGVDLRELQRRMGHASIRTTEKYLHVVAASKRRRNVGAPL